MQKRGGAAREVGKYKVNPHYHAAAGNKNVFMTRYKGGHFCQEAIRIANKVRKKEHRIDHTK